MNNLFNFKHIRGDFFGGLTAGIVALPLALAFGTSRYRMGGCWELGWITPCQFGFQAMALG